MTLKQIEYFQMVCEKENISAAADALYISRSVVSRAISDIEETFGTTVFIRSKNGVSLTESGKIVASLFNTFVHNYSAAQERIRQLQPGVQKKPLRLGVTPTNAYAIYQNYLENFQELFSDIPLKIEEYGASDGWDKLLDGTLDAFFTPAAPNASIFDAIELYENSIMLGAAADDPLSTKEKISIADLLDLPLAFFNAPMPIEHILNTCFEAFGKHPRVFLRTSDLMLIHELTVKHKVYPILTQDMMIRWENVRQVPLDFMHTSINRLVWSRALPYKKEMEIFLSFMRNTIK